VEGADGRPAENGAAELLAFMYDKSLELLASHHPPSVLSLYPELTFPDTGIQMSGLMAPGTVLLNSSMNLALTINPAVLPLYWLG